MSPRRPCWDSPGTILAYGLPQRRRKDGEPMMFKRPTPTLEDRVAVIHSPAGVAARRKRCEKIHDELKARSGRRPPIHRNRSPRQASSSMPARPSFQVSLAPMSLGGPLHPHRAEKRAPPHDAAQRNLDGCSSFANSKCTNWRGRSRPPTTTRPGRVPPRIATAWARRDRRDRLYARQQDRRLRRPWFGISFANVTRPKPSMTRPRYERSRGDSTS